MRGKIFTALLLTVVGGYVDAVGYIALFQIFTANMSGNSIHIGMNLGRTNWWDLFRPLCAVASYVVGMMLTRIAIGVSGRAGFRRIASAAFAAEAALLAAFAHARPQMHLGQIVDQHSALYFAMVAWLAFAMGIQTATLTHVGALTVYTTFVTGTLTKWTESVTRAMFWAYDHVRRTGMSYIVRHATAQEDMQESAILGCVWLSYVLGAALGTVLKAKWELRALYLPVAILLAFIVMDQLRPLDVQEERHQTGGA